MKLENFDVLYADPPWGYEAVPYFKKSLAVQYQYPPLSDKDLYSLDIGSIAKKDSWLFVWGVWAQIKQCLNCIEAWGFRYCTCAFLWTKRTKTGKKAKTFGRSCGAQGSTEFVLVAKKGSPKHYLDNEEQEFEALREGHSRKPDIVYEKIERLVTPPGESVKKIELFARQQYKDWYALGNDENLNQPDNPLALFGDIREFIPTKGSQ